MSRSGSDFRSRDLLRGTNPDTRRRSRSPVRVQRDRIDADDYAFRSRHRNDISRVSPERERKRKERSSQASGRATSPAGSPRIASRGEAQGGTRVSAGVTGFTGDIFGRGSIEASLASRSMNETLTGFIPTPFSTGSGVKGVGERSGSQADPSSLDSFGTLVPRSMVLDDGTVRTFYTLRPDASLDSFSPSTDGGLPSTVFPTHVDAVARYGAEPRQTYVDTFTRYIADPKHGLSDGLGGEDFLAVHDRRWTDGNILRQDQFTAGDGGLHFSTSRREDLRNSRVNEYMEGPMYNRPEPVFSLHESDGRAWDMKYLEVVHAGGRPFRPDDSGRQENLHPGDDVLSRGIPVWKSSDSYADRRAERRVDETVHDNDFAYRPRGDKGGSPLLPMRFSLYSEDDRLGLLSHDPDAYIGASYRAHMEDGVFGDKNIPRHDSSMQHEFASEEEHHIGSDFPEGSLEFKQQVYKAFMNYTKTLNENLEERKKYEEQGKAGTLLCLVCGRFSKPYADTHSLVMHTFVSQKRGLRAEHLGLRKAICTLMGWSSVIEPGNGKLYQQIAVEEAKANKKDLILWPPAVIVHNAYAGKTSNVQQEGVKNSAVEDLLKDSGVSREKIKLAHGEEGAVIVKYEANFSCLNEAERLHQRFATSSLGREDWLRVQPALKVLNRWDEIAKIQPKKRVLYGYLALAGDLDKVDSDFRCHCTIRSRKEIEAILNDSLRM